MRVTQLKHNAKEGAIIQVPQEVFFHLRPAKFQLPLNHDRKSSTNI